LITFDPSIIHKIEQVGAKMRNTRRADHTRKEAATLAICCILAFATLVGAPVGAQVTDDDSRYGETPEDLIPFRGAGEPYSVFFTDPPQFRGPGRSKAGPTDPENVPLGVLIPEEGIDFELGKKMRNGVELAVADANRDGGYRDGIPFVLAYRDESQAWGASANAAVDLTFNSKVWGLVGALEDNASHVMSRLLLKIEMPVVNTNGSDPTLTEHLVPWMLRMRPDDRRNGYRLAHKIFVEDGHQRVVVFRANDRYARMGIIEFSDAARRLGRPIQLEVRFQNHDTSWDAQIERIRNVDPEAVVLWGRAAPAGKVLAAMRAAGIEQPVYGPDRLVDPVFLEAAGNAAEGLIAPYPFDPESTDRNWRAFRDRYRNAYGEDPDATAAFAYDGTSYLVQAIREAGLNRVLIRDRLFFHREFQGVTGTIRFDKTQNNISPVLLQRVQNGVFVLEQTPTQDSSKDTS
jgi:branched-chain amino acid transport system substrate-binding protein